MSSDIKKTVIKDEVAPAKEKTMAEQVADAVRIAVTEAIPAAVMAAAQIHRAGQPTARVPVNFGDSCSECGQHKRACYNPETKKQEHRLAVVFPRTFSKGFPGIWINGVLYCSAGPGHQIVVPAGAPVEQLVNAWEKQEREYDIGRERAGRQLGAVSYKNGVLSSNVNLDKYPMPMTDVA